MKGRLSARLKNLIDELPLRPGIKVLEIGCGTGAAAREILQRIGNSDVLAIDRSAKAITQAKELCAEEIRSGRLRLQTVSAEDFIPGKDAGTFDLAFAIRVGALDGRHPEKEEVALQNIRKALKAGGSLYVERAGKWLLKTLK